MSAPARMTPREQGALVREQADRLLRQLLGDEAGQRAAARVAIAYQTLVARTPRVADCSPQSIVQAVAMSAMTGLYPAGVSPGCYVIPRESRYQVDGEWRSRLDLHWQVSAVGLRQLARAAGYDVTPVIVYEGDTIAHADGSLDELSPVPPRLIRGAPPELPHDADPLDSIAGVVVVARHVATMAAVGWMWVPCHVIRARRRVSDAYTRGVRRGATDRDRASPWFAWPEEMAMKTAVRYALTGARAIVPVADTVFQLALEAEHDVAAEPEQPAQPAQPARSVAALDRALELDVAAEPEPAPTKTKQPAPGAPGAEE